MRVHPTLVLWNFLRSDLRHFVVGLYRNRVLQCRWSVRRVPMKVPPAPVFLCHGEINMNSFLSTKFIPYRTLYRFGNMFFPISYRVIWRATTMIMKLGRAIWIASLYFYHYRRFQRVLTTLFSKFLYAGKIQKGPREFQKLRGIFRYTTKFRLGSNRRRVWMFLCTVFPYVLFRRELVNRSFL